MYVILRALMVIKLSVECTVSSYFMSCIMLIFVLFICKYSFGTQL